MADPVQGQQSATSGGSDFNAMTFIAKQLLALISTSKVVKVIACTNDGGLAPVGYVDVQPLVNQIDGAGLSVPHGIVYGLPYSRLQGGANAIIIDPTPGDIGVAIFSDRDISNVKATKDLANPGSYRRFDVADGVYLGMILNAVPEQYIQFNAGGINIVSPQTVVINAGADVNITATGHADVTAGGDVNVSAGGDAVVDAAGEANVTAPAGCNIDANTVITGTLKVTGGVKSPTYSGLTAGTGTMTVHSAVIDTAQINGIVVDTHTHTDPQGGTVGPMQ